MISVIIPSYNREKSIIKSVMSVLNQTYSDIELIVVDDCSADNTVNELLKIKDKRLKVIKHSKNLGACSARNTGIKNSSGEFIAFQDSDDIWRNNKLEKQMSFLIKTGADVCFCQLERHGYKKSNNIIHPILKKGEVNRSVLILNSVVSTQTILAKSKVFHEHSFDSELKRLQDYDWVIRASESNTFCFLNEVLVDVYYQNDSITEKEYKNSASVYEILTKKYNYLCESDSIFYAHLLYNLGFFKIKIGKNGIKEIKKAAEINRKYLFTYILARIHCLQLLFCIKNLKDKICNS